MKKNYREKMKFEKILRYSGRPFCQGIINHVQVIS